MQLSELIPDETSSYEMNSNGSANTERNSTIQKKKKIPAITFEEKKYVPLKGNLVLAIVPENEQILHVSNFSLFIINDSNYHSLYELGYRGSDSFSHIKSGLIEPDRKKEIGKYSQSEIAKIKEFKLQGIFFKHGLMDFSQPVDLSFNIEDVSFYKIGFFKENEYFNEKAIILKKEEPDLKEAINKLSKSEFAKVIRLKETEEKKPVSKQPMSASMKEVDLHIGEIMENYSSLSNGEIVEIQIGRFETSLDTALLSGEQKIVFIHGVGNGKLKNELRNKLDKKYPHLKYQDASFKEYGYGATIVYLK
jgi:hypothetical protein